MRKIIPIFFLFTAVVINAQTLRAPAVPLITFDPYFSCWSFGDNLNESTTKHWTGKDHTMLGLIRIDAVTYRFMGMSKDPKEKMAEQTKLTITATQSIYEFTCGPVNLKLSFISPLLINNLKILSRPVGYITYEINLNDNTAHEVQILFGVTPQWAVNTDDQLIMWEGKKSDGFDLLKTGTVDQKLLNKKGDDLRIDWGYLYFACKQEKQITASINKLSEVVTDFENSGNISNINDSATGRKVSDNMVLLSILNNFGKIERTVSNKIFIAFDDGYSIQYFGQNLRPFWNIDGKHKIEDMIKQAAEDYIKTLQLCQQTDNMIYNDAFQSGDEEHAQLCVLAYRQAIAAHKLVVAADGSPLFFSKENFSNGSIGTVDVTFPSAPLFVAYNTTLLKAMMEPIFYYYESGKWTKNFPAHDLGTYPLANGQTYNEDMPIEECGNMLILATAITIADGNSDFATKHFRSLSKWALYLSVNGLDPGNQLCTDDFAGHLAHNAHLSIKAILGLKSYAVMAAKLAMKDTATKYNAMVTRYVQQWMKMAQDSDHYRLAFDKQSTWSQKYNLVWDKALGFNIFPPTVFQNELRYYLKKQNKYGLPLDNCQSYGKCDEMVWTACIARDYDTYNKLLHPVWLYVNETSDRIPLSDWHQTITGKSEGFRARSVIGGFWIKVMEDKLSKKINQ